MPACLGAWEGRTGFHESPCIAEMQELWLVVLLLQCKVTEQTNKSQPGGGVAHLGCKIPPVCWLELHLLQSGVQPQG